MAQPQRVSGPDGFNTAAITVSNAAKLITDAGFAWGVNDVTLAEEVYITPRNAGIMVTWSGVAPTANLGHYVGQNSTLIVKGFADIRALQFIREGAVDAVVSVTLSKFPGNT